MVTPLLLKPVKTQPQKWSHISMPFCFKDKNKKKNKILANKLLNNLKTVIFLLAFD